MRAESELRAGVANPNCANLRSKSSSAASAPVTSPANRGEPLAIVAEWGRSFIETGSDGSGGDTGAEEATEADFGAGAGLLEAGAFSAESGFTIA